MKKPKLIEVLEQFEKGPAILCYNRPQYGHGPNTMTFGGKRYRVVNVWSAVDRKLQEGNNPLIIVDKTVSDPRNDKLFVRCANLFKLSDSGKRFLEEYNANR